jgi:hypothetical protein
VHQAAVSLGGEKAFPEAHGIDDTPSGLLPVVDISHWLVIR